MTIWRSIHGRWNQIGRSFLIRIACVLTQNFIFGLKSQLESSKLSNPCNSEKVEQRSIAHYEPHSRNFFMVRENLRLLICIFVYQIIPSTNNNDNISVAYNNPFWMSDNRWARSQSFTNNSELFSTASQHVGGVAFYVPRLQHCSHSTDTGLKVVQRTNSTGIQLLYVGECS